MSMYTPDQLADALSKAVERLRDAPVTAAEHASYRNNTFKVLALADELGVALSELQATFSHELYKRTGNTALPAIPTDPPRRMQ